MTAQTTKKVTTSELLRIREKAWSVRLRGCSLVAELDVDERHSGQVARVLGRVYAAKYKGTPRAGRMFLNWPACVAVALTGIAGRDYRRGELWPELWEGLGYRGDGDEQGVWGRGFLAALNALGLSAFPELPMPYLGPILMHTGIPNYCLEDYFRLVSQRRTVEPGLDAEGFLSWATGGKNRLSDLDMPARRFLEYGTDFALDFVDRTFDLLDRLRTPAPDLDGVDLPPRVMARAQELAAEGRLDLRAPRGGTTGRTRVERPRLGLDPFGRGLEVVLPAVGDTPDGFARWNVTADGVTTTIRSQAEWAGVAEAAPSTTFTLLQPVRTVVVALEGSQHQTELRVVDPKAPLLVFADDGRRLSANLPLPPDLVWVAYPEEYELIADGEFRVTIEGQLPLGWNGWLLRQVTLEHARSLALDGLPASHHPVRGYARPRIVTAEPVAGVTTPYGTAVHARPPELWLPGEPGACTEWTVELRPGGSSEDAVSERFKVEEPTTVTGVWDRLPQPLLGSYDVVVRGPLGRGMSRTVFLAQGLDVRFTPRVRLFGADGLTSARAELGAAIGAVAQPRAVSFTPEERATVVEYRTDHESEPLVITPPHLQVMHERADQSLVWRAGPVRIEADAFADQPGALLVQLPEATVVPSLQVAVGGQLVQDVSPSGRPQRGTARYDLIRLADTIAEHKRAELLLEVDGHAVRVASVRPRQFAARTEREGDRLRLVECVPVEGLTAGVYVTTAPWREPLVATVTADGTVPLPEELRQAGPLLVTLQVDDPWVPVEWPRWPERFLLAGGDGYAAGDDPEETALSRFLSGEGEFPEEPGDLCRVWTLIHLARRLRTGSDVPRFLQTCARPLLRRPLDALTALAALALEPEHTVAAVISSGLAATLVAPPVPSDTVRRLWPVAPVLGALAGGLSDPDCRDAAERQCGATLTDVLNSGVDPHAAVGRFGPEAELMQHMDPRQLDGLWRAAQVVPQDLLDADTRLTAARRLFDRRLDADLKPVARAAPTVVRTARRLLSGRPVLLDQVEARTHPLDKAGWFALPAASAAFALFARLAARGHRECRSVEQTFRADWARLAAGAPDLVTIDLILAELLVGSADPEVQ